MADGLDPKSIAVLLLLTSVLFHYFSYSFTLTAYDYSQYDVSLSIIDLYSSGIMIGEWEARNVTYENATWTVFEVGNETIRCRWANWWLVGKHGLLFQKWTEFFTLQPWVDFRWLNIEGGLIIRNQTMIAEYDYTLNLTIIKGITGYVCLIQDPTGQGNITDAVMDEGMIQVVIAEDVAFSSEPDLNSFMSWYLGLVTGSETWGLPDSFGILVRIMSMLGIFSGIFLLSEVRRIII